MKVGLGQGQRQRLALALIYLVPLVFLTLFFFYPLFKILALSLFPEGQFDPAPFLTLATDAYYTRVLAFTGGQALLSTALTVLAGMPAALVFRRYDFRGKCFQGVDHHPLCNAHHGGCRSLYGANGPPGAGQSSPYFGLGPG